MSSKALLVSISLFVLTLTVNLESPLYIFYAKEAGFGSGPTALAFAAYVAGLLPVLIFFGGSSDRLGRKPVLLFGLALASLATALMIISPTIYTLFISRTLQGIGVGLSVGAGTAYLAELIGPPNGPTIAASYVAITTSLGFGGGALSTTLVLLFGQSAAPLSYWVVFGLTLVCLVMLSRLPNIQPDKTAPMARLPYFPSGSWLIGLTIAVAWAVTGLAISVVPTQLARHDLATWLGLALFLINGTGVLCQPLARRMAARQALLVGFVLVPAGYLLLILGAWLGSLVLVLVGAAMAGAACYGFTYLGGLAEIARAGGSQRARAVSGYFLFAYLGFGLPSVIVGFLADSIGSENALVGFGLLILGLSCGLAYGFRERSITSRSATGDKSQAK